MGWVWTSHKQTLNLSLHLILPPLYCYNTVHTHTHPIPLPVAYHSLIRPKVTTNNCGRRDQNGQQHKNGWLPKPQILGTTPGVSIDGSNSRQLQLNTVWLVELWQRIVRCTQYRWVQILTQVLACVVQVILEIFTLPVSHVVTQTLILFFLLISNISSNTGNICASGISRSDANV